MKPKVDKKKCIGCGLCVSVCPAVFVMKDGKADVKDSNTSKPCAKEAKENCPVKAISIK